MHSAQTGAPGSFVQIVFREWTPGGHFIGGEPADAGTAWVHGHIRAGRTEAVKNAVLLGIRGAVAEVAAVPEHLVWVYLTERPAPDMVEFGRVLPEAGQEQAWRCRLPPFLRERLRKLDRTAAGRIGSQVS